ncbi:MAG: helix-turn-helix domain-containing protein [Candidatus Baltobacteraceae bacterium]
METVKLVPSSVPRVAPQERCPSQDAIAMIGDKWKLLILIQLSSARVLRFKELQRALAPVSQKVLTGALRELERDGLVERTVYPEVPPRVEYRATGCTASLLPIVHELGTWATLHAARNGGAVPER